MAPHLAQIVAKANVSSLSLIGLAKNVGTTTTTNHLLASLLAQGLYRASELALTSWGLDGEAVDALTGLPKPRYVPQPGMLVATTAELLRLAENEGVQVERLQQLPGRTALGPVVLARIIEPGRVIIAGPTLLRDLRSALDKMQEFGARLSIVDGAINRLGAASPEITDACILCTGASAAATPALVARRTAGILSQLTIKQTPWIQAHKNYASQARLLMFCPHDAGETIAVYSGLTEPMSEAAWIVTQMGAYNHPVFILNGALSEELAKALLAHLSTSPSYARGLLTIKNATKILCHISTLQKLEGKGLQVQALQSINILALTINPYTPEYACTSQQLMDALLEELPAQHPPAIDVVSGLYSS